MNITARHNDLDGFFYPLIYYIKDQIINHHVFPLWNNTILAGTPLLPDPQSTLFYPPNLLFLILPINFTFILIFILHSLISLVTTYLIGREFKFDKVTAGFISLIYTLSPKVFGLIEAGHYGLVISYYLLPLVLYCSLTLSRKFNKRIFLILIISLIGIFLNHTITFLVTLIGLSLFYTFLFFQKRRSYLIILPAASFLLTLGLVSFVLFPQIDWAKETTRSLLLISPDTYPKWNGFREFIVDTFVPLIFGKQYLWNIDVEKWLTLGLIIPALSIVGFIKSKRPLKIVISIVTCLIILISLNNISPIYQLLIKINFFDLTRVMTRFWLLLYLIIIFLAGFGLKFIALKNRKLSYLLMILAFVEIITLSLLRINKPIDENTHFVPDQVYEYLKQDQDLYRVFCISRCIPQGKAAENNLQLIEGYSTLIQMNYYKEVWQFTGQYWNYYTLSIPPFGTIDFEKIKPDPHALGLYNTKYIISPYKLEIPKLILQKEFSGFFVYLNEDYLPRSYFIKDKQFDGEAKITKYSPNEIIINTPKIEKLIISQPYNKDWRAYLNGTKKVNPQETPDNLVQIDLDSDTKFIDYRYEPGSLKRGGIISIITFIGLFLWMFL